MGVLYGIKKLEAVFSSGVAITHVFDELQEANYEPKVSEGETKVLRGKHRVIGVEETEDIVYGALLEFQDKVFSPELIAKIDGGTITYDAVEATKVVGYKPPKSTNITEREEFVLNIYCKEKDGEVTTQYVKYSFPRCKGRAFSPSLAAEDFHVQDLRINAYETETEPHYSWDYVDKATVEGA